MLVYISLYRYGESNRAGLKYKQAFLPQWSKDFVNSFPPNDLTVTNVSQSYHLSVSLPGFLYHD